MTMRDQTRAARGVLFIGMLSLFAFFVLSGCGSSRQAVTLEEESAVQTDVPDSLVAPAPADLPDVRAQTLPQEVLTYEDLDTLSAAVEVTAVTATPGELRIRTRSGETTYQQPATGETLVLEPDMPAAPGDTVQADTLQTTRFKAGVAGEKKPRTVQAKAPPEPADGWGLRLIIAVVVGILFLIFLIKLV